MGGCPAALLPRGLRHLLPPSCFLPPRLSFSPFCMNYVFSCLALQSISCLAPRLTAGLASKTTTHEASWCHCTATARPLDDGVLLMHRACSLLCLECCIVLAGVCTE